MLRTFALLIMSLVVVIACDKGLENVTLKDGRAEFGFFDSSSLESKLAKKSIESLKKIEVKDVAFSVLISIIDQNGENVYENEVVELVRVNDDFLSLPIKL